MLDEYDRFAQIFTTSVSAFGVIANAMLLVAIKTRFRNILFVILCNYKLEERDIVSHLFHNLAEHDRCGFNGICSHGALRNEVNHTT